MLRHIVCVASFIVLAVTACTAPAPTTPASGPPTAISATAAPAQATAPTFTVPTPDVSGLNTGQSSAANPSQADQAAREFTNLAREASGLRGKLGSQADEIFRLADQAEAAAVQDILRQLQTRPKAPGVPAPLPPREDPPRGVAQGATLTSAFGLLVTSLLSLSPRDARPAESDQTLGDNMRAHVKMTPTVSGSRMEVVVEMTTRVEKDTVVYEEKSSGKISLNVCPDEGGNVPLDLTFQSSGGVSGAAYEMQLTQHAIGHVDAEGDWVSTDYQIQTGMSTQGGQGKSFAQVNMQFTVTTQGSSTTGFQASVPRASPQISQKFVDDTAKGGMGLSITAAVFALGEAEVRWQDNYCVAVVLAEEGTERAVPPSSEISFSATVHHRFEGRDLPFPIIATLTSGAVSVTPAGSKVPPPATFRYKAPDKAGEKATVELISRSRRGIGKLILTIKTEEDYFRVYADYGPSNGMIKVIGSICALDKPFTLNVDGHNASGDKYVGEFAFMPTDSVPPTITSGTPTGKDRVTPAVTGGSWKHTATSCTPTSGCGKVTASGTYQLQGVGSSKPVIIMNPGTLTAVIAGQSGTWEVPRWQFDLNAVTGACSPD